MDRDKRWERVKRGYDVIVDALLKTSKTPQEYIKSQYEKDITDEFIEPISFEEYGGIKDNDSVLMANFRSDRMRQITQLLGEKDYMPIKVSKKDIKLFTMSEYSKDFSFPIIFTKEIPKNTLCETISKAGLTQFHTAETEKYAHVTFFLNGGVEEPFFNETRVLIPSPKVQTYDLKPQMSAYEVKDVVIDGIKNEYDFIVVNFANGDMVGHTGNFEAAKIAVNTVDTQLGLILKKAKEKGVEKFIIPAASPKDLPKAIKLAEKYDEIYFAVGIHPIDIVYFDYHYLTDHINHPKCVAVGEIGLDYHHNKDTKDYQIELFQEQLDIAMEYNKPVIIHIREASKDSLEI